MGIQSNESNLMNPYRTLFFLLPLFFTACGYRGDLYLPYENDPARFGIWQTGAGMKPPVIENQTPSEPQKQFNQEEK